MIRILSCLVVVLSAVCANLFLEVREVRSDQRDMGAVYDDFLKRKVKGKPLADRITKESLAVMKAGDAYLACARMEPK